MISVSVGEPKSTGISAYEFAKEVHKDDRRRYTNEPYLVHLSEVVSLVMSLKFSGEIYVTIAWLHDTFEMHPNDDVLNLISGIFGIQVAKGVLALTDMPATKRLPRSERKQLARDRLQIAPSYVQTIKVADMISNVNSIIRLDKEFAKVYVPECKLMLDVLAKANSDLTNMLHDIINKWEKENGF